MDYKQSAQELADKGRYGDSMLVHMNPKEVAGMQYLGSKYGAKMTVNPSTGLPEAFNFSRFLPMIVGAALAPYTGGTSAALIVGGVETARTGNIMKGLQAGLGAFGGANIATSLGTMGAEQAAAQALPVTDVAASSTGAVPTAPGIVPTATPSASVVPGSSTDVLRSAASQNLSSAPPALTPTSTGPFEYANVGYNTGVVPATGPAGVNPGVDFSTQTPTVAAPPQPISAPSAAAAAPGAPTYTRVNSVPGAGGTTYGTPGFRPTYSQMGAGIERLGTTEGLSAAGSKIMADPMSAIKTAGSLALSAQEEEKPYQKPGIDYSKYPKAEPYKRQYVENPDPRRDREFSYYQPNALYVKDGGQTRFNVGGLSGGYTDYMQQLQQMINRKDGADPSMPTQSGSPLQMMASMAKSGEMGKMKAYKTGGLEDGGFVLRASTVNGVGNGSSEAGLKYLQQKLGAVPIKGSGDGMSDSIPTTIAGKRKALVSNEEAYVPRNIVSRIGGGDINEGAAELDKFMKRVDKAKTGKPKPPRQINPDKYLPKRKSYA